jgi:DNA repair protein RAD57
MTDLLNVLPDTAVKSFAHILPSLEKAYISCADLLTLEAIEIARRARLPPAEIQKLVDLLLSHLLPKSAEDGWLTFEGQPEVNDAESPSAVASGNALLKTWRVISTLDDRIDAVLGGGVAAGHVTEIVGERLVERLNYLVRPGLSTAVRSAKHSIF